MGQKTSVYLSDELAARIKASGMSPADLIRRGLDAAEPESMESVVLRVTETAGRRVVREEVRQAIREELAALQQTG